MFKSLRSLSALALTLMAITGSVLIAAPASADAATEDGPFQAPYSAQGPFQAPY